MAQFIYTVQHTATEERAETDYYPNFFETFEQALMAIRINVQQQDEQFGERSEIDWDAIQETDCAVGIPWVVIEDAWGLTYSITTFEKA